MEDKQPASAMVRVPTPLIDVVKELSRLHRLGKTQQLLQALGELIAAIDSETDIAIVTTDSSVIADLIARVEKLEAGMMQPAISSQRPQNRPKRTITPPADKSVDRAGEDGSTLKQLAAEISLNYTRLSATRQKMGEDDFLEYLSKKSAEAGRPRNWRYDPNVGKGRFFPVDSN